MRIRRPSALANSKGSTPGPITCALRCEDRPSINRFSCSVLTASASQRSSMRVKSGDRGPLAFGVKQREPDKRKVAKTARKAGLSCQGAVVPVDHSHDISLGTQRHPERAQAEGANRQHVQPVAGQRQPQQSVSAGHAEQALVKLIGVMYPLHSHAVDQVRRLQAVAVAIGETTAIHGEHGHVMTTPGEPFRKFFYVKLRTSNGWMVVGRDV